jgi:hypothetical protein
MLPEALDSEQREPTELLGDIGHDFPPASQGPKEGAPGKAGDINQPTAPNSLQVVRCGHLSPMYSQCGARNQLLN